MASASKLAADPVEPKKRLAAKKRVPYNPTEAQLSYFITYSEVELLWAAK